MSESKGEAEYDDRGRREKMEEEGEDEELTFIISQLEEVSQ